MAQRRFSKDRLFQPSDKKSGQLSPSPNADDVPVEQPLGIRIVENSQLINILQNITQFGPESTLLDFSYSHFTKATLSAILQAIDQSPCDFVTRLNFTGCNFGEGKQDCFDLLGPFLSKTNVTELMCEGIQTDKIASLKGHLAGVKKISFGLSPEEIKRLPQIIQDEHWLQERMKPTEAQLRLLKQIVGICQAVQGAPIRSFSLACAMLTPETSQELSQYIPAMSKLTELLLPSLFITRRQVETLQDPVKGTIYNDGDAQEIALNLCRAFEAKELKELKSVVLSDIRLLPYVDYQEVYVKLCDSFLNRTGVEQVVLTCPQSEPKVRRECLADLCRASNREMLGALSPKHDPHNVFKRFGEWSQLQLQTLFIAFQELRAGRAGLSNALLKLITSYTDEPRLFETYPVYVSTQYFNLNQPEMFRYHFAKTQKKEDIRFAAERYHKVLTVAQPAAEVKQDLLYFHAFRFWVATTNNYLREQKFTDQVGPVLLNFFDYLNKQLELDMYNMSCLLSNPKEKSEYLTTCMKRIYNVLNNAVEDLDNAAVKGIKGGENYDFIVKTMTAIKKRMILLAAASVASPSEHGKPVATKK